VEELSSDCGTTEGKREPSLFLRGGEKGGRFLDWVAMGEKGEERKNGSVLFTEEKKVACRPKACPYQKGKRGGRGGGGMIKLSPASRREKEVQKQASPCP